MPFPAMQKLLDESFLDGTYNYWKSTFLAEMSDDVIDVIDVIDVLDVIVEHADRMQSPLSSVVVEFYAGAASRVGQDETAFTERRALRVRAFILVGWRRSDRVWSMSDNDAPLE